MSHFQCKNRKRYRLNFELFFCLFLKNMCNQGITQVWSSPCRGRCCRTRWRHFRQLHPAAADSGCEQRPPPPPNSIAAAVFDCCSPTGYCCSTWSNVACGRSWAVWRVWASGREARAAAMIASRPPQPLSARTTATAPDTRETARADDGVAASWRPLRQPQSRAWPCSASGMARPRTAQRRRLVAGSGSRRPTFATWRESRHAAADGLAAAARGGDAADVVAAAAAGQRPADCGPGVDSTVAAAFADSTSWWVCWQANEERKCKITLDLFFY